MASRNRTLIFRKYRDALKSVRIPSSSSRQFASSGSAGGPVIELVSASLLNPNRSYTPLSTEDPGNSSKGVIAVGLPPAWVDVSEDIAANVQRARTKMVELAKTHAKALMPSFGDGKEDQRMIESLTQEVTDLIRKSEKKLQRLSAAGPSEDSNIRKNVQHSLATDLQNLSMELRKKQSMYLKRLRQQKEGQDGVDLEINLNGRSRMDDDNLDDMVFNEHQMAKLKKSEEFTVEREREIQQVVESVNEIAQIMKDLSVLVIDQGTIIDRIDYNIQNVASTVEEGLQQLQKVSLLILYDNHFNRSSLNSLSLSASLLHTHMHKHNAGFHGEACLMEGLWQAERTQKQGGMVMCATVLIIMCFIMLVLLILKEIFL